VALQSSGAAARQLPYPAAMRPAVWVLAIGQMFSWAIYFYVYPALLPSVQKDTGWAMTQLTLGPAIALVTAALISPSIGRWIDLGHGRTVLAAGPAIGAAGLALWAQAGSIELYWLTAVLLGIATATALYDPVFMFVTRNVPIGYPRAIVVITLAGGLASTVEFPFAATALPLTGWRGTLLIHAAVGLLLVLPLNLWATAWMRARSQISAAAPLAVAATATVPEAPLPLPTRATGVAAGLVRQPVFWCLVTGFSGYLFVVAGVWQHLLVIGETRALSKAEMLTIIMMIGPAQVASRLVQLLFGHRWSEDAFAAAVFALFPVCLTLLVFGGGSFVMLAAFAVLFGLGNGAVTLVRGTAAARFFGLSNVAATHGAMSLPSLIAKAAGPFVCAAWVVALGGLHAMLLVLLAIATATAGSYFLALVLERHALARTAALRHSPPRETT
jgi:MFS family permease